jgi:hypothetical protein
MLLQRRGLAPLRRACGSLGRCLCGHGFGPARLPRRYCNVGEAPDRFFGSQLMVLHMKIGARGACLDEDGLYQVKGLYSACRHQKLMQRRTALGKFPCGIEPLVRGRLDSRDWVEKQPSAEFWRMRCHKPAPGITLAPTMSASLQRDCEIIEDGAET